jgi:hypothetical protein
MDKQVNNHDVFQIGKVRKRNRVEGGKGRNKQKSEVTPTVMQGSNNGDSEHSENSRGGEMGLNTDLAEGKR